MDRSDGNLIKITHYINPHMFWFKYESSFFSDDKFSKLHENIATYYSQQQNTTRRREYKAQVGEVVGVYCFSWDRWIRAEVDHIFEYNRHPSAPAYIVWAIDYGVPLQVENPYIQELPKYLADFELKVVHFGGIADIIPADKEYDFLTSSTIIVRCKKWSPYSVKVTNDLINDAACVRFITKQKNAVSGQVFGDLEIVTHTNKIIKPETGLLQSDHAIRVNEGFLQIIHRIGTNKLSRWKTDDGRPHFYKSDANHLLSIENTQNRFKIINEHLQNRDKKDCYRLEKKEYEREIEIEQKINEWQHRNQKSYSDVTLPSVSSIAEHKTKINEIEHASVDNDNNEIFVAEKCNENLNSEKQSVIMEENMEKTDCEAEIATFNACGSTREKRQNIYRNHAPPPPSIEFSNLLLRPQKGSENSNENSQNSSLNQTISCTDNEYKLNTLEEKRNSKLQEIFEHQTEKEEYDKVDKFENSHDKKIIKVNHDLSGQENLSSKQTCKEVEGNTNSNSQIKRPSLSEQVANANKRVTQNAIPAGFDLTNLQPRTSIANKMKNSRNSKMSF